MEYSLALEKETKHVLTSNNIFCIKDMALPLNINFFFLLPSNIHTGEGDYKYYPDLIKKAKYGVKVVFPKTRKISKNPFCFCSTLKLFIYHDYVIYIIINTIGITTRLY